MIQRLSIRNYAIIDHVELDFSENLSIITGETGAGKSIMLGALGLIMGRRADLRALYNTDDKCVIEGTFNIANYKLQAFFETHALDYETEIIIRRELTPSGKSRAFVNDTPVKLNVLQTLSDKLIDLHQQFDTLDIHEEDFQLTVVDALAETRSMRTQYETRYRIYQQDKRKLQQLIEQRAQALKESDFLQFQLEELQEADLQPNEQDALETEQDQLNNAEEIKQVLNAAFQQLNESEFAITGQLAEVNSKLNQVARFHPKLPTVSERLEGLLFELQDIASDCERIGDDTEYDEERLQLVNERLNLIFRLQTKHQVGSVEELLALQAQLEQQTQSFEQIDEDIETLEATIQAHEDYLFALGAELSDLRKLIIDDFEAQVHQMLQQLSMKHARVCVDIQRSEQLLPQGIDIVRFLFAPNKGSRFEEIKGIASGGELSRLTLCIKALVADAIPLPTLIFDEIDAGVSGDVALRMGEILQQVAELHQVICITHSPQIAAKASRHFFVHKKVAGDKTFTDVKALATHERIEELAKMLSGDPPSEFARQNARELLAR